MLFKYMYYLNGKVSYIILYSTICVYIYILIFFKYKIQENYREQREKYGFKKREMRINEPQKKHVHIIEGEIMFN